MSAYNVVSGEWLASEFSIVRGSEYIHIAKIIILGEGCESDDSSQPMTDNWEYGDSPP